MLVLDHKARYFVYALSIDKNDPLQHNPAHGVIMQLYLFIDSCACDVSLRI